MIEQKLKKIVGEFSGRTISEIQNSDHYVNNLYLDSLDLVELIMEVERTFNVIIENAEEIPTVQLTIDLIEQQSKQT
jgi:acyl carrier protein